MSEMKRVSMWWWPWQMDKVEKMLEDNAAQGWILVKANWLCTRFTFEKRTPARIRYCLDYQDADKPEYRTLLGDAGWMLEFKGSGWYIWSMAYDGERPELFTDTDSLIRRNNAVVGSLAMALLLQLPIYISVINNLDQNRLGPYIMVFWALLIAVLAGLVVGMAIGNRKFQRGKGIPK